MNFRKIDRSSMRLITSLSIFFLFIAVAVSIKAQRTTILAKANGVNYTAADLDPATREAFEGLAKQILADRTELLGEVIAQMLFKEEASAGKTTVDSFLEAELPKRLPTPTAAEIQAVYDANKDSIGGATLAQVRPQIVQFLQRESYPKAMAKLVADLKLKHKVVIGKDVNALNLLPTDVLATVDAKPITVQFYNEKTGQALYELRASIYEKTYDYLETIIYNSIVAAEAKKFDLNSSDLIAREITDKMKDYSAEEREMLEKNFRSSLYKKYGVSILLTEPPPFIQKISVDDDPSTGSVNAPVTIVMFSDFQCPACSATHPVLKKVMADYSDKIRFVVRDYPLTQIHKNSFKAAEAANAANAQGKFFEYIELLYNNQESLDTPSLKSFAAQIGLDPAKFAADLDSGKFADEVKKDAEAGNEYGVNSTPTIFVNGYKVRNLSAKAFREAIDRVLKN